MDYSIDASTPQAQHYLVVQDTQVTFCDPAAGAAQAFTYDDIQCVLLSPVPDNVLSVQVGGQVFRIKADPARPGDQQAVAALLRRALRTVKAAPTGA